MHGGKIIPRRRVKQTNCGNSKPRISQKNDMHGYTAATGCCTMLHGLAAGHVRCGIIHTSDSLGRPFIRKSQCIKAWRSIMAQAAFLRSSAEASNMVFHDLAIFFNENCFYMLSQRAEQHHSHAHFTLRVGLP